MIVDKIYCSDLLKASTLLGAHMHKYLYLIRGSLKWAASRRNTASLGIASLGIFLVSAPLGNVIAKETEAEVERSSPFATAVTAEGLFQLSDDSANEAEHEESRSEIHPKRSNTLSDLADDASHRVTETFAPAGLKAGIVLSEAKNGQNYRYTRLARPSDYKLRSAKSLSNSNRYDLVAQDKAAEPDVIIVSVPPSRYEPIQREAKRYMMLTHALSVVDGLATLKCAKSRSCQEANPIYGKSPSALTIIGIKGAMGLLTQLNFDRLIRKSPWTAKKSARLAFGLQGAITGFTLTQAF